MYNLQVYRLPPPVQRQRGVVLILAMFIVVLVTAIAVSTSWRFELGMMRNENRWHGAMVRSYGYSAENFVLRIMQDDDPSVDCLQADLEKKSDLWAADLPSMPTDEGSIDLTIEDLNRRFNINMLAYKVQLKPGEIPKSQAEQYTEAQRMFIRLLQTIEIKGKFLDPAQAIEITDAVIDWVDEDSTVQGSGGAEANYYEGLDDPYSIGNRPMISVSELALVKGVTPELFAKLSPLVAALNSDQKININTMLPQLERMFNTKDMLEPYEARRLESLKGNPSAKRPNPKSPPPTTAGKDNGQKVPGCAKSVDEAMQDSLVLADLEMTPGDGFDKAGLKEFMGVNSSYFAIYSEVRVGELVRVNKSLIKRAGQGQQGITVIRRTDGNF